MPAKPSNQAVLDAIQSLSVGMGAELVALRSEVEKLSLTITGLSHMLANKVAPAPVPTVQPGFLYKPEEFPLNAEEKAFAAKGDKIEAIKLYRARIKVLTGFTVTLLDAKELVFAYIDGMHQKECTPPYYEGSAVAETQLYTPEEITAAKMPLNAQEKALAGGGHKVKAIIEYRGRIKMLTGLSPGLKEAKELVEAHISANKSSLPDFDIFNPPPMLEHHKHLVKQGMKIDAIKEYRAYTQGVCNGYAGLKEAKDIIDAYAWTIGKANFAPAITFNTSPF